MGAWRGPGALAGWDHCAHNWISAGGRQPVGAEPAGVGMPTATNLSLIGGSR